MEQRIRENCQTLLKLSQKYFDAKIFYSYKANYLPAICQIITEEGLGAEVATEFEYNLAVQLGVPIDSIILSAPYKSPSFLQKAIQERIGLIIISHPLELKTIASMGAETIKQKIGLRLRSPRPNKQLGLNITKQNVIKILDYLSNPQLELTTLQLHSGTQIDAQNYKDGIDYLMNIANLLESQGITISQLDFGGGFPEAISISEEDIENLFILLLETLHDRGWQQVACLFEPGRYIVGDAGILLAQIVSTFEVRGSKWIMLNTGNHQCPKFSNSNFRFELIDRMSAPHNTPLSIAGCLPTDMDVLAKRYPFPDSYTQHDNIAIFNAGAYTITWSTRFSFPFPPLLLINKNQCTPLELPYSLIEKKDKAILGK